MVRLFDGLFDIRACFGNEVIYRPWNGWAVDKVIYGHIGN